MTLFALFFIITALGNLIYVSGKSVQTSKCPASCEVAWEWCATVFGRGGNVSSRSCGEHSLKCVCNERVEILVSSTMDVCTWEGNFDKNDFNSSYCFPQTALCPGGCNDSSFWTGYCMNDITCREQDDSFEFSCTTYDGGTYIIFGKNKLCTKQYKERTFDRDSLRVCKQDDSCRKADNFVTNSFLHYKDYEESLQNKPHTLSGLSSYNNEEVRNREQKKPLKTIFMSMGSTWTMVLPSLSVLFLFVMLGLARGDCESDYDFQSTALRKTGLSAVQVARRNQPGMFRKKNIPKRPAQSRCLVKDWDTQEETHGFSYKKNQTHT